MKIKKVGKRRSTLGEAPHWDARTATLIYVDRTNSDIIRFDPETQEEVEVINVDGFVGNAIPCAQDGRQVVACVNTGIYKVDLDSRAKTLLTQVDDRNAAVKCAFSDGKCDAMGRLWAGTMPKERGTNEPFGKVCSLYCYSKGKVRSTLPQVSASSGIAWTSDDKTMYFNDSVPGKTYAFDYDLKTGTIQNRQLLIDFKSTFGYCDCGVPNGMTCDVNDKIWMTCFGTGTVLQIDPETAKILTRISLPTKCTTSCCFGGKDYDVLYVTSGSSDPEVTGPDDGMLYQITELGAKGSAPFEFIG
ncbi:regucalcin [Ixodes scapularis]|uniref:regucalcin n=1 Tax=Ixodes scapularis TaxID=6945 RepID=UPI001C395B03|nr:regucalcin [Ixodes scapularis]